MTGSGGGVFACTLSVQTITGFHALYTEQKMGELGYQGLNVRCADRCAFFLKFENALQEL